MDAKAEKYTTSTSGNKNLIYLQSQKDAFNTLTNPSPYWEAEKFFNDSIFYRLNFKISVKKINFPFRNKWEDLALDDNTEKQVEQVFSHLGIGRNNYNPIICSYGKKENGCCGFDVKIESKEMVRGSRGSFPKYRISLDIHIVEDGSSKNELDKTNALSLIMYCAKAAQNHLEGFSGLYKYLNPQPKQLIQNKSSTVVVRGNTSKVPAKKTEPTFGSKPLCENPFALLMSSGSKLVDSKSSEDSDITIVQKSPLTQPKSSSKNDESIQNSTAVFSPASLPTDSQAQEKQEPTKTDHPSVPL